MGCNSHEVGCIQRQSLLRFNLDKTFFLLNVSCTCPRYEDLQAVACKFSDSVEEQVITRPKILYSDWFFAVVPGVL